MIGYVLLNWFELHSDSVDVFVHALEQVAEELLGVLLVVAHEARRKLLNLQTELVISNNGPNDLLWNASRRYLTLESSRVDGSGRIAVVVVVILLPEIGHHAGKS